VTRRRSGEVAVLAAFDFYIVLLSIVVSISVAGLLTAVVRLIQASRRVRFAWTWAVWAVAIFALQVLFWLRSYSYRDLFQLRLSTTLPPLALAILAFLASGLVTPHVPDAGPVDLAEFHRREGRKYIAACMAFSLTAVVQTAVMSRYEAHTDPRAYWGPLLFASVEAFAIWQIRRRSVSIAAGLLLLVGNASYYLTLMPL